MGITEAERAALKSKKELLYGKLDRKPVFKSETTEKEGDIMLAIIDAGVSGISIGEIEKRVSLDRKTVRRYTTILLLKRYVKRVNRGKTSYGRFFATRAGLGALGSRAILLGNLFARRILQERLTLVQSENLTRSGCVDFSSMPEFLEVNQNKYGMVRSLFEFSSAIGTFVVFLLIQSMNKRGSDSRVLIERALAQLVPFLLPTFKSYVEKPLLNYFKFETEEELLDFLHRWRRTDLSSEFNFKIVRKLSGALGRLYPYLWYELDKANNNIPKEIESMFQHSEYVKMKKQFQSKCKHDFVQVKDNETYGTYTHCKRCHYTDRNYHR